MVSVTLVAEDDLSARLEARVRDATEASRRIIRRSAIVVEASRYVQGEDPIPRCASCGKVGVGGEWLAPDQVPAFLADAVRSRASAGICPDCFGDGSVQHRGARLTIHAGGQRTADALAAALSEYGVEARPDHVLEIRLEREGDAAVNRLLTLVAECLRDRDLEPVHVRLADGSYTLDGR